MKKALLALTSAVALVSIAACSGGGGGGGGAAGLFLLAIGDSSLVTDGSGAAQTTLLVARQDYDGPITITLGADAPAGITMDPLTIAAGSTSGLLVVHKGTAALGGPFRFTIVGTGEGDLVDGALLDLLITGPSGTPDTTFGGDGIALLGPGVAHGAIEMPDDSLVVAGHAGGDFVLVRVNTAGLPVASFGSNGRATLDFSGGDDWAYEIVRTFDGKLVVAGSTTTAGDFAFAAARFTPDGALDETFGDGGKVVTRPGFEAGAWDFVMQPNGKLLAAGTAFVGSSYVFTLVRYETTGALDATFGGGDGIVNRALGDQHAEAYAVTVRTDGIIIASGYSMVGDERRWTVAFFDEDGASIGPVTSGTTNAGEARGVSWQQDGTFFVGGKQGGLAEAFAAKLDESGDLDSSWGGGDGHFTVSGAGNVEEMVVQQDGRIVLAGDVAGDFVAWRATGEGIVDSTWGASGMATVDLGAVSRLHAAMESRDTRLVLIGESGGEMAVTRLWP